MSADLDIPAVRAKIALYLEGRRIPVGLGTKEAACTIAAVNLALTGRLTDELHECMCPIIRAWVIRTQDTMGAAMRNAPEWRAQVPRIAGSRSTPEVENARLALIVNLMWETLARVQPKADKGGFGAEWREMCEARTTKAAEAMRRAACVANAMWAILVANSVLAAEAAAAAASASRWAGNAAALVARVEGGWRAIDPASLLKRLLDLGEVE